MATTPDKVILRQHGETHRYYDGARYKSDDEASNATWWVAYFGDKEEPMLAEEDVLARDKSEASAVARAALARDFDPGVSLTKVVMA